VYSKLADLGSLNPTKMGSDVLNELTPALVKRIKSSDFNTLGAQKTAALSTNFVGALTNAQLSSLLGVQGQVGAFTSSQIKIVRPIKSKLSARPL